MQLSEATSHLKHAFPGFKHNPLHQPAGTGPMTRQDVEIIQQQIATNAAAVPSRRGGGLNGHVYLVVRPQDYNTWTNNAPNFIPPTAPAYPPPTAAGAYRMWEDDVAEFDKYHQLKNVLVQQLIEAVGETRLVLIAHPITGFKNTEPLDIINFLWTHCGKTGHNDLDKNKGNMMKDWNPDTHEPLHLYAQLLNAQKFAANSLETIPDFTLVSAGIRLVNKTGKQKLLDAVEKFEARAPGLQTLGTFQSDITSGYNLYIETTEYHQARNNATTGEQGYANAASAPPPATPHLDNKYVLVCQDVTFYYCATHGLSKNESHTSATCNFPGPNHDVDSTFAHPKQGCRGWKHTKNQRNNNSSGPQE